MRSRILMLLGVVAWAGCALAQIPVPVGDPPPAAAVAGVMTPGMTVPVMINGQGPFQFAIDSGSTQTLIAAELAERLGLPPKGSVRVHALGGIASLRTVMIDTIQFSASERHDIQVAAVPHANLWADGLLGLNLLKNQRVTLDFAGQAIRIEPSTTKAPNDEKKDVDEIVISARMQRGQLVMADADADGQKVWVIIDSGSQMSIGNIRLMDLLVKHSSNAVIRPVGLMDVIGRTTEAQYTYVNTLRVGGLGLSPIPIAFADAHPFKLFGLMKKPSLLLGMETLENFSRVEIDFATRKVTFQLPKGKLTSAKAR